MMAIFLSSISMNSGFVSPSKIGRIPLVKIKKILCFADRQDTDRPESRFEKSTMKNVNVFIRA